MKILLFILVLTLPAIALADYRYWKETKLNSKEICDNQSSIDYLVNTVGFKASLLGGTYHSQTGYEYVDISNLNTRAFKPSLWCKYSWTPSVVIPYFGVEFRDSHIQENSTVLEMQADATYFRGDGGPKVDIEAVFKDGVGGGTGINGEPKLRLQLLYLSHSGWEVITEKTTNSPVYKYSLTAQLPYPTQVKFRISAMLETWPPRDTSFDYMYFPNPPPDYRLGGVEIGYIKMYTQECVPNLANPGLCL